MIFHADQNSGEGYRSTKLVRNKTQVILSKTDLGLLKLVRFLITLLLVVSLQDFSAFGVNTLDH